MIYLRFFISSVLFVGALSGLSFFYLEFQNTKSTEEKSSKTQSFLKDSELFYSQIGAVPEDLPLDLVQ